MTDDTTDTTTDAEKINHLLMETLGHYDPRMLTKVLVHGQPAAGHGGIVGEAADVVEKAQREEWSHEKSAEEWARYREILPALKLLAQHGFENDLQRNHEVSGLGGYLHTLEDYVFREPDWLARPLLQHAIDRAEASTFDDPDDWRMLIGVLQIEANDECYGDYRDEEDNREDRREAWDELLKFTKYRATVTYDEPGDEGVTLARTMWAKKSTTAHNRMVNRVPDQGDIVEVDTWPLKRAQPGLIQDPLQDLEPFVYYDVSTETLDEDVEQEAEELLDEMYDDEDDQ